MNRVLLLAVLLVGGRLAAQCHAAESLATAWSQALAASPQLDASRWQQTAAAEDLAAAQASRLPDAGLRGSYTVRSDERNFRFDNPLAPGQTFVAPYAQREAAGAAAIVTAPLYAGGAIRSGIRAAESRLNAATCATATSRLDLLLAVAEAYLAVLRAQRELAVADQNLQSLASHEAEVHRHFTAQQTPKNELLAAQVATAAARYDQVRRQYELQTARGVYNRLLSRPLTAPVELEESQPPALGQTQEQLQEIALHERPDVAELQASVQACLCEAERLRVAARPHVMATGRHDFEENRYQTPQGITSAAVVVDWNVYDGGRSRRAAAAEEARASSLGRQLDDLKSQIALGVMTQWTAQFEAAARLQAAAQAVTHAEENLRVVQCRYAQGVAVSSDVLEAQSLRTRAASDYYNASYDVSLARLRLRHATGLLGRAE
ncbi:MAG: TolC family protein [Pirellulales bacterium]|nr:TolC family protein [Pirellulales bacterium]